MSWGGYESLVLPVAVTDVDPATRGFPVGLIRLHVGLEEPAALIEDLDRALRSF